MSTGFLKELGGAAVTEENILLNEDYARLFKDNSLQTLLDFMSAPVDNAYRSVKERLTVGLDLKAGESTQRVYLKRHWSDTPARTMAPFKEAYSEWGNIQELKNNGIPVPDAMAVGDGIINGHSCAFILMKEVPGIQADEFIEQNFDSLSSPELYEFMRKLGVFAAQFHKLGYNHRDFYLCHTFVHKESGGYVFHLIDLQRVQKRQFMRRRWIVKDLAQFNYSALKLVDEEGRRIFYDTWCENTGTESKKLLKAVEKKTAEMVKREERGKVR